MKKEKSNIDHLRNILNELQHHEFGADPFNEKIQEANEFVDAIEEKHKEELLDLEDSIKGLEEEKNDLQSELNNADEMTNYDTHFVGLDTLYIQYKDGNMKIQQQVESFIERLQRENAVVPA